MARPPGPDNDDSAPVRGSAPVGVPGAAPDWDFDDEFGDGPVRSHRRSPRTRLIVGGLVVAAVLAMAGGAYASSALLGAAGLNTRAAGTPATHPPVVQPDVALPADDPTTSADPGPSPTSPSATRSATARASAKSTSAGPVVTGDATLEGQVLTLVNQERAKVGCRSLTLESHLTAAARAHSQDMIDRNFFDHTNPSGVTPAQRVKNAGYTGFWTAENIAAGQDTAASVMKSWMNSQGHRDNILSCGSKYIGIGMARGGSYGIYWTQDFGR